MCTLSISALCRDSLRRVQPLECSTSDHSYAYFSPPKFRGHDIIAMNATTSLAHLLSLSSFRHSRAFSCSRKSGFTNLGLKSKKFPRVKQQTPFQALKGDSGSGVDISAVKKEAVMEKSAAANEELLLFFFELDLNTRLQKALNQDQYEAAQQIREKITEVEQELARLREMKMGASSKDEAQEKGLIMLRIKTELQRAVEEERYGEAATLRDNISKLEAEALAASLKGLAASNAKYEFRLGQKIRHKEFEYRGVVCGMDPVCCESEEWAKTAQVEQLPRGRNQPFYQVLLDLREVGNFNFTVAYVAEENLLLPEEPDMDSFNHPYIYLLFFGLDGNGDYIPTKQLRDKYYAPRHEIPYDENSDGSGSSNDDS